MILFIGDVSVLMMGGCSPTLHTRGNYIDLDNLKKIKIKETSRSDVHLLLGPPSSTELFTGKGWYYIGEQTTTRAFFKPDVIESHLILIEFDATDKVVKVERVDQTGYDISPDSDHTPTYGRDPSVLSEVFGNIGRYADSYKGKKS